jgi:hypothetical protein
MITFFLLLSPFMLVYLLYLCFSHKEKQQQELFIQRQFILEHGHGGK